MRGDAIAAPRPERTAGRVRLRGIPVALTTDGPSTIAIQDAAFNPGGHNGWHTHAGLVVVTLISGSLQWFDANCETTFYKAGDSWLEGSQPHYFRILGSTGAHLSAVFIVSKGEPLRIDHAAPSCAVALGLN